MNQSPKQARPMAKQGSAEQRAQLFNRRKRVNALAIALSLLAMLL